MRGGGDACVKTRLHKRMSTNRVFSCHMSDAQWWVTEYRHDSSDKLLALLLDAELKEHSSINTFRCYYSPRFDGWAYFDDAHCILFNLAPSLLPSSASLLKETNTSENITLRATWHEFDAHVETGFVRWQSGYTPIRLRRRPPLPVGLRHPEAGDPPPVDMEYSTTLRSADISNRYQLIHDFAACRIIGLLYEDMQEDIRALSERRPESFWGRLSDSCKRLFNRSWPLRDRVSFRPLCKWVHHCGRRRLSELDLRYSQYIAVMEANGLFSSVACPVSRQQWDERIGDLRQAIAVRTAELDRRKDFRNRIMQVVLAWFSVSGGLVAASSLCDHSWKMPQCVADILYAYGPFASLMSIPLFAWLVFRDR